MKIALPLLCLFLALAVNAATNAQPVASVTRAPARIELTDQFELPQRLSFPATNLTVLTIADHKGSEQIAGWVTPVKARYGSRVAIIGIADVSAVPGWLRGMVRKKFRQRQSYPVMLDWTGNTVKAFAALDECVNVFVLDERGWILKRFAGEANPGALKELSASIDLRLTTDKKLLPGK